MSDRDNKGVNRQAEAKGEGDKLPRTQRQLYYELCFQAAERGKHYQLFVMRDADPFGYNMARTLREATPRTPVHQVNVIDLGLTLPQAVGYQPNHLPREETIDFLTGRSAEA